MNVACVRQVWWCKHPVLQTAKEAFWFDQLWCSSLFRFMKDCSRILFYPCWCLVEKLVRKKIIIQSKLTEEKNMLSCICCQDARLIRHKALNRDHHNQNGHSERCMCLFIEQKKTSMADQSFLKGNGGLLWFYGTEF